MDIISSLLDRFKSPNKKDDESYFTETFENKAILAICILMIEVSRSDDKFDDGDSDGDSDVDSESNEEPPVKRITRQSKGLVETPDARSLRRKTRNRA